VLYYFNFLTVIYILLNETVSMLIRTIKNDQVQTFLQELTPTASTDYSLWKATKNFKRVTLPSPPLRKHLGTWANSNVDRAHAFAHHLSEIFNPTLRKIYQQMMKLSSNFSKPPIN
jgi:hypothetical protein